MEQTTTATSLKEQYVNWLSKEIQVNQLKNHLEITSPFLDRFNDYLQVYVTISNSNQIHLTDDGYIIDNLKMSGIDIQTNKRKDLLENFLRMYGINCIDNKLSINTSSSDFPQKLLLLMQAMLKVDDMFMLSQSKVASLFNDDIKKFFTDKNIYYSENVCFIGKSGFYYSYDYLLQRTKNKPERLCKAINNPNIQSFRNNTFMWTDTKEKRNPDSQFIVLLNDNKPIASNVLDGFANYGIETILWSEKEKKIDLLTA